MVRAKEGVKLIFMLINNKLYKYGSLRFLHIRAPFEEKVSFVRISLGGEILK